MNITVLLIATVLMWIAVLVGLYQRIFLMPKWFENPPASFELIRKQSKTARSFWIPLSILIMISFVTALILNWDNYGVRIHIYPLQKKGDDFFFTGKAKVSANTGDVIAASLFFGIIGGLIASDAEATFDMKVDHLNGGFIRLREVKTGLE